jgi:DNA repair protein RadC
MHRAGMNHQRGGIGMKKADHSGHRDRLRAKYLSKGIETLAPHEVLELLLFYAVPYRNTNDMAKNLIDRFGSLSSVFDASFDLLIEAGLTQNQATFLKLIPDTTRLYMLDRHENVSKIVDIYSLCETLPNRFIGKEDTEHVMLLLLDSKGKEIFFGEVSQGEFNQANISIRKIVQLALNYNAAGAILVHNHPSGYAEPSQADYRATVAVREALRMIGVELLDHFVVADHDCVSMAMSGLLEI